MKWFGLFGICTVLSLGAMSKVLNYSSHTQAQYFPDACMQKQQDCLIVSPPGGKYVFRKNASRVELGENASILKKENGQIHLVKGEIFIQGNQEVFSEYGSFLCQACEALLQRKSDAIYVKVLKEKLELKPPAEQKPLVLTAGYEIYLGGYEVSKKRSSIGLARPVLFRETLQAWAKFFEGSTDEFREEVKHFQRFWAQAVYQSADAYTESSRRSISSEEEKREKASRRRKQKELLDQEMRELFRKRNLSF